MPYSTQATFAELYVVDAVKPGTDDVLDLENPSPSEGAELPCPAAIEFMADVHEARGKEGVTEAVQVTSHPDSYRVSLPNIPVSLLSVLAFPRPYIRYNEEKVRGHLVARHPSVNLVTGAGTGNFAFEMQLQTPVKPKALTFWVVEK